jgi:general secretion pathway protein E
MAVVMTIDPKVPEGKDLGPQLAEYLESAGIIRAGDLSRAKAAATTADKRLDEALVELGIATEDRLTSLLATVFHIEDYDPDGRPGEPVLPDLLSPPYLASAQAIPIACDADTLTLAMVDAFDDFTANAIALKTDRTVLRKRITPSQFESIFPELYGELPGFAGQIEDDVAADAESRDIDVLRDAASDAPVIRFVQETIRRAVVAGASDIHLKPSRNAAELQFRVDGTLVAQASPDAKMLPSILSRLKILANLDISERRLPQDGRIRTSVGGRPVDIRIATMPHIHGEAAVLRILSREIAISSLSDLGFSPGVQDGLGKLFGATEGLVLVTGPTGSGKSTTLHAALRRLIRPELNVVTIEDPVEYRIDGAAQIQVDEKIGLTFPRVLRSLLRQDPDIILVGEIRDAETARIAVQAALTGHLVLATLHTNSATAAVPRLVDMGIEPYLLAAVLRGVLAQRLVRKLCPSCAIEESRMWDGSRESSPSRKVGPGCTHCSDSGYVGRLAIGELVLLDPELTEALAQSSELPRRLMERLTTSGYQPLRHDAMSRVSKGEVDPRDIAGIVDG